MICLQVVGGVLLLDPARVDPEQAHDRVRDLVQRPGERGAEARGRRRAAAPAPSAVGSARVIASIFGTCSPIVMCSEVAIAKAIANEIAVATPWPTRPRAAARSGRRSPARRGSRSRSRHRDPDLAGGEVLVDPVELLERLARPALALLGERLDPAPAGAHERELGGDEEPVERGRAATSRTRDERRVTSAQRSRATLAAGTSEGGRRPRGPGKGSSQARAGTRARAGDAAGYTWPAWTRRDPLPRRPASRYADRDPGRFHVPGHKGGAGRRPGAARGDRRAGAAAGHPGRASRGSTSAPTRPTPRSSRPSGSPPRPGARSAAGSWSTAARAATTRSASRSRTSASGSWSSATSTPRSSTGSCSPGCGRGSSRPRSTPSSGSPTA